jgi:hypothetical protein
LKHNKTIDQVALEKELNEEIPKIDIDFEAFNKLADKYRKIREQKFKEGIKIKPMFKIEKVEDNKLYAPANIYEDGTAWRERIRHAEGNL